MGTGTKILGTAGALGTGYLSLDIAEESGNTTASEIKDVVDSIGGAAANVLNNVTGISIGDSAPLSQLGIQDLANRLGVDTSLGELGVSGIVGLGAGYLGGKATQVLGKLTNTESDTDNKVGKTGGFLTGAFTILDSPIAAGTAFATSATYIVSKKLAQLVLSEKYAHYLGLASTAGMISVAFGANDGTVIASMLGAGTLGFIGDKTRGEREKRTQIRQDQGFMKAHLGIGRSKKK